MSDRMDIGAVRELKIDVLTETGWFDDARFKEDMAAGGGSEQTQYKIAWDAENAGGYAALLTLTLLDGDQRKILLDTGWNTTWMDYVFSRHGVDAMLERGEFERPLRIFSSRTFSEPGSEDLREERFLAASRLPEETILSFYDRQPPADFEHISLLNELSIPTLIMPGTADQRVPFEDAGLRAERVETAQLHAFEDRGHVCTLTAIDEFCDVLRQFVRVGTAPPPPLPMPETV